MHIVFILLFLSFLTNTATGTTNKSTSKYRKLKPTTQDEFETIPKASTCPRDPDELDDDIEKQLIGHFEKYCLISQDYQSCDQEKPLSPELKQHLENIRFIFRESHIAQNIYEHLFGKETVTPENLEAILQTISQRNDDEIFDMISFFFSEETNGNCPILSAASQENYNIAMIEFFCTDPRYKEQIHLKYTHGSTVLHNLARQNLRDNDFIAAIRTIIKFGADAFEEDDDHKLPIDFAANRKIKFTLLKEMMKHPKKYLKHKANRLKNCIRQNREFIFACSIPISTLLLAGLVIWIIIDLYKNLADPHLVTVENFFTIPIGLYLFVQIFKGTKFSINMFRRRLGY